MNYYEYHKLVNVLGKVIQQVALEHKIEFNSTYLYFVSGFQEKQILHIKNIYCPTFTGITIGTSNIEEFDPDYKAVRMFEDLFSSELKKALEES